MKAGAMQVWPLLVNLPQRMVWAASSRSALSSITVGDLPPSSSVTLVRCLAAAAITTLPMTGEPVKKMWSNGRLSSSVETSTSPSITATSSSGNTSRMMRDISAAACGVISDGLMMTVLPAAMAEARGPKLRFTG